MFTAAEDFASVLSALTAANLPIVSTSCGLIYQPLAPVEVDDATFEANEAMLERLLQEDDVDSVYTNCAGLTD